MKTSTSDTAVIPQLTNSLTHQFTNLLTDDSTAFRMLAQLSPAEYDRTRKQSARNLGIRVETLDAEVTRVRNQIREDEAFNSALSTLHSPLVWPDPVNG